MYAIKIINNEYFTGYEDIRGNKQVGQFNLDYDIRMVKKGYHKRKIKVYKTINNAEKEVNALKKDYCINCEIVDFTEEYKRYEDKNLYY